jgi:hypothetical protein
MENSCKSRNTRGTDSHCMFLYAQIIFCPFDVSIAHVVSSLLCCR